RQGRDQCFLGGVAGYDRAASVEPWSANQSSRGGAALQLARHGLAHATTRAYQVEIKCALRQDEAWMKISSRLVWHSCFHSQAPGRRGQQKSTMELGRGKGCTN